MSRVIDLSWPITEKLPIEIGRLTLTRDYDYGVRGFRSHQIEIHSHNGTHIDAPEHTEPGGAHLDEIAPDRLYGEGVVLDLTPYAVEDKPITVEHVKAAEAKLKTGIKPGDFVLLRTDWSKNFGTAIYWPRSPYLAPEAAAYLVKERKVRGLGYDFSQEGGARDHADLQERINRGEAKPGEDLLVHHIVLGSGLYHVECMTNFAAIPNERFKIVVAPLNLKGVEAAPARVFAIIE